MSSYIRFRRVNAITWAVLIHSRQNISCKNYFFDGYQGLKLWLANTMATMHSTGNKIDPFVMLKYNQNDTWFCELYWIFRKHENFWVIISDSVFNKNWDEPYKRSRFVTVMKRIHHKASNLVPSIRKICLLWHNASTSNNINHSKTFTAKEPIRYHKR